MKALIISADYFEDSELLVPYYRLKEARVEVDVAPMKPGTIKGKHGYEVAVDKILNAVNPEEYARLSRICPEDQARLRAVLPAD